jgi:acyl carrier protein
MKEGWQMADGTFEAIQKVLVAQLSLDAADIKLESDIADDLGADSLDAVELIMSLEDEFGVTIEAADAEGLKTVGDVVSLIDSLKA